MSNMWRKTMVYLGLVEEPEEHDELPEQFVQERRPVDLAEQEERRQEAERLANVRPLRPTEPGAPHVRAVPSGGNVRVAVVAIEQFDDVEEIGSRYRSGQPVLLDLGRVDKALARRVLDFVAGLTYALHGKMTKSGGRAFLVVPDGVEITPEERSRLGELGYRSEGA